MELTVTETQRARMLEAMLEELAARGYAEASVEAAREAAGVSGEEFRAEFADKDECLFAAYEQMRERALELTRSACSEGASWPERVREGLAALLEEMAERPQVALAATRLFPAIRPEAYERYTALLSSFVPYIREGREHAAVDGELPGEVELLAIGAAESLIFGEIEAGGAEQLPEMLPEILFSVLVPFIGPERAAEEMRSAAAR